MTQRSRPLATSTGASATVARRKVPEPFALVDPFVEQQLDVVAQELSPLTQRDDPWRTARGHVGRLCQDPRVAQDAAANQNAADT